MAIEFTDEQVEQLYNKGFTDEDLEYTIKGDRANGLSDDAIKANILKAIGGENQQPQPQKTKGIDLTPSGLLKNRLNSESAIRQTAPALLPALATGNFNAAKEIYTQAKDNVARNRKPTPVQDAIVDIAGYGLMPASRAAGGLGFASNVARFGTLPGLLEGMKNNNALGGAILGTGLGAGVQKVAPIVMNKVGQGLEAIAKNPSVQKNLSKTLEVLTSVPSKYTNKAIEKELQGQSILKGKLDAESAYRPVEKQLAKAKSKLPTNEGYADKYYELGQKAKEGLENIKNQAGNEIEEMLGNLKPEPINIEGLRKSIDTVVNKMGKGGGNNPAEIRASRDLQLIRELLGEEGTKVKPLDLHNAKEILYDMANYDTEGGIRNELLKQSANQIKNFLRSKYPEYKAPNDKFAQIKKLEYDLGGINSNTIGGKLSKYGDVKNIETGLDRRLRNINDILPDEYKFIDETKKLVEEQKNINEIKKLINSSYERNPRLLSNINDEARETALQGLQDTSGINFMDELNNIRAQEALSKWFPGQGGGSGSEQGFGNLVRTAIIGGTPGVAAITHNPAALLGLGLVSPKFMAGGTVKNLGALAKAGEAIQNLKPLAQRLLTPLAVKGVAPIQHGGISYTEEN